MTYQEALEMEQRCMHKLRAFPEPLHYPVVLYAHRLNQTSMTLLAQETYAFFHERFVERETVTVECQGSR